MEKKTMTPWGLARIEVIAAREDIEDELRRGVPMKRIHDALAQSGRVTVTYNSFRRQIQSIRDMIKSDYAKCAQDRSVKPASQQVSLPKTDDRPSGEFQFNPSCKADDFF